MTEEFGIFRDYWGGNDVGENENGRPRHRFSVLVRYVRFKDCLD